LKTLNTSAVSVAQERKSWVSIAVPALEFKSTIADFQLNSLDKESWKPAIVVKSRIGMWINTHSNKDTDSNLTLMVLLETLRITVKYKLLHMNWEEICGSQVRALPHGFRGCWLDPSRVSAKGVCGVCEWCAPKGASGSGYAFWRQGKKRIKKCNKKILLHQFRFPSFAFHFPSKRKWWVSTCLAQ